MNLDAQIDNISIFSTNLSIDEIQLIDNHSYLLNHPDIVSFYNFNSGGIGDNPNTIFDLSGNQRHYGIMHPSGATWIEKNYGCTDESACNFNPEANNEDYTCDYSCHNNGDYALHFNGYWETGNDQVIIDDLDINDISRTFHFQFYPEETTFQNGGNIIDSHSGDNEDGYVFSMQILPEDKFKPRIDLLRT